jgi:type II secretory pathway pseudopilin PulG
MTGRSSADAGFTLLEMTMAGAIVIVLSALVVPVTGRAIDAGKGRHAAGFIASRARLVRQQAVFGYRAHALVFDLANGRWVFRVCRDENHNGVRRVDIAAGIDPCLEGPHDVETLSNGTKVAVDPALPGPGGEPGSPDPVRFGQTDMFSCSFAGTCTAGSVYLRSPEGVQFAVRILGATGRTRILKYDPVRTRWDAL